MATEADRSAHQRSNELASVVRAVTVIMGTVVGLTFLVGFGNVLNLALRLGVTPWVAPLVAPAVDLSVLGLLLATRHLALTGAPADMLRPARRPDYFIRRDDPARRARKLVRQLEALGYSVHAEPPPAAA